MQNIPAIIGCNCAVILHEQVKKCQRISSWLKRCHVSRELSSWGRLERMPMPPLGSRRSVPLAFPVPLINLLIISVPRWSPHNSRSIDEVCLPADESKVGSRNRRWALWHKGLMAPVFKSYWRRNCMHGFGAHQKWTRKLALELRKYTSSVVFVFGHKLAARSASNLPRLKSARNYT